MRVILLASVLYVLQACQSGETVLEKIPDVIPQFKVTSSLPDALFDGYIQVRKITAPGSQIVLNKEGEVVWYQLADTALFRPFTPKLDRYLALHDDRQLYEITYDGDTLLSLAYGKGGFDRTLHHEIIYDGENIAALTKEKYAVDLSSLGGKVDDSITTDGILILDRDGNKVWHWSITDVLDPLSDPDLLKYKTDWGHANSLDVDVDGNFLISWRNFNEVWKVDRSTGKIIWRYGDNEIRDNTERFYGQHSFHVTEDGSYMLFDNGDKRNRSSSRALGFTYKDGEGFKQTLSISLPDSLFTSKQGSVYQIADDRYLFSSSMSSSLVLTNRNGDILWFAKSSEPYYRAYYLDEIRF